MKTILIFDHQVQSDTSATHRSAVQHAHTVPSRQQLKTETNKLEKGKILRR